MDCGKLIQLEHTITREDDNFIAQIAGENPRR